MLYKKTTSEKLKFGVHKRTFTMRILDSGSKAQDKEENRKRFS